MNLLRMMASPGYPPDYLVTRIMVRRAALIGGWQPLLAGHLPPGLAEEDLWHDLLAELSWLYTQMNPPLRQVFAPVFSLFELRTLTLCLRHKATGEDEIVRGLLSRSLLAAPVKKALRDGASLSESVAALDRVLRARTPFFRELEVAFSSGGLQALESALLRCFLAGAGAISLHPLVEHLLRRLSDLRNLLLLNKQQRWQLSAPLSFFEGGYIAEMRLRSFSRAQDPALLPPPYERLDPAATAAQWEAEILRSLTGELRRRARLTPTVGPLLDYLWRRYIEVRNLGVLLLGADLGRESLAAEVVS